MSYVTDRRTRAVWRRFQAASTVCLLCACQSESATECGLGSRSQAVEPRCLSLQCTLSTNNTTKQAFISPLRRQNNWRYSKWFAQCYNLVFLSAMDRIIVTIWNVVFANKSRKLGWIWMKLGRWGWGLKRLSFARFKRNRAMDFGESAKKMGRRGDVFCDVNDAPLLPLSLDRFPPNFVETFLEYETMCREPPLDTCSVNYEAQFLSYPPGRT